MPWETKGGTAAAYAFIAYQCAYLKYYYRIEFYTALLTVFGENAEKAAHYISDARDNNIQVVPPSLNRSQRGFSITGENEITYGFESMKGIRTTAIDEILENRPYETLEDLILTAPKSALEKASVKALALSGGFDEFAQEDENRMSLLMRASLLRGDKDANDLLPEIEQFSNRRKLEEEKRYLGAYLSGHPLDGIAKPVDWELAEANEDSVTAIGVVTNIHAILTKKKDPMAFLNVAFLERDVDVVVFTNIWSSDIEFRKGDPLVLLSDILEEGMLIKVKGRYEKNDDRLSFLASKISIPVRLNSNFNEKITATQEAVGYFAPEQPAIEAPRMVYSEFDF